MVRSLTFEIRWHDTQPIYSASFQPIDAQHLRRVLDHNKGQAMGKLPSTATGTGATSLAEAADAPGPSTSSDNKASAAQTAAARAAAAALPINAAGQSWRLATAGADNNARIWKVHPNVPSPAALASAAAVSGSGPIAAPHPPRIEYLATLSRHTGSVNVVRFCPQGDVLATASDDGTVLFWVLTDQRPRHFGDAVDESAQFEKEFWRVRLMTRATERGEIYDLSWAPNGDTLAVGATDSITRIINAHDGTIIRQISEHALHVQGVAWDPLNEYLATQSADRSVHVHSLQTTRSAAADGASMISITTHTASRNSRMDLHRRTNSGSGGVSGTLATVASSASPATSGAPPTAIAGPASAGASGSSFVWDPQAKPPLQRRASSHSHASDSGQDREYKEKEREGRSGRSGTPSSVVGIASAPQSQSHSQSAVSTSHAATAAAATGRAATKAGTPTPSVPPSPFSTASASAYAMHPPQRTPSRRSSFSGSNADVDGPASPPTSATSLAPSSIVKHTSGHSEGQSAATANLSRPHVARATSASAPHIRSTRSPSPMPPLPAIRAPPSPRQQIRAAQSGRSQLAKVQLYGDQQFSGFFRRLCFSPDGSLLVTPAGVFDTPPTPTSPTVGIAPGRKGSDGDVGPSAAAAAALANTAPARSTVYLYARGNLHRSNAPIARLPAHKSASVVVRFSPILYQLRPTLGAAASPAPGETQGGAGASTSGMQPHTTIPLEVGREKTVSLLSTGADGSFAETSSGSAAVAAAAAAAAAVTARDASPAGAAHSPHPASTASPRSVAMIGLPYRMIFAVATYDSVWIYDTQQSGAICCFSNMHYAAFTDLTWSPDGQTLIMSSTDGYCSIAVFDYGELGAPYQYSAQPSLQHVQGVGGVPPPATHAHGGAAPPPPVPHRASTPAPALLPDADEHKTEFQPDAEMATDAGQETPGALQEPPKKKRRIAPTLLSSSDGP